MNTQELAVRFRQVLAEHEHGALGGIDLAEALAQAALAVLTTPQKGDARERLRKVVARGAFEDFSDYPLDGENALVERVIDALLAAFPVLSRTTSPDAATEEMIDRAVDAGMDLIAWSMFEDERVPEDAETAVRGAIAHLLAALDGAPEAETPELFPGTNAALDRLTVRKAAPAEAFCIEHGNFHAVELGDPTCEFEDGFGEPVEGEKP